MTATGMRVMDAAAVLRNRGLVAAGSHPSASPHAVMELRRVLSSVMTALPVMETVVMRSAILN